VFCGEDLALFFQGNLGVDLRCQDGTVAQHSLYVADIHVFLQQQGGESVPEHMRRYIQVNGGFGAEPFYQKTDRLFGNTG
jgi:hypothetical protein